MLHFLQCRRISGTTSRVTKRFLRIQKNFKIIVTDALRGPTDHLLLWSLCVDVEDEACQCGLSLAAHQYELVILGKEELPFYEHLVGI